jgi:hypothetical protein
MLAIEKSMRLVYIINVIHGIFKGKRVVICIAVLLGNVRILIFGVRIIPIFVCLLPDVPPPTPPPAVLVLVEVWVLVM